jgi:Domain of unknown function (DUF1996)
MTAQDLKESTCTSCAIDNDHSVYWTPPLYFQHSNGTIQKVIQDASVNTMLRESITRSIRPEWPLRREGAQSATAVSLTSRLLIEEFGAWTSECSVRVVVGID